MRAERAFREPVGQPEEQPAEQNPDLEELKKRMWSATTESERSQLRAEMDKIIDARNAELDAQEEREREELRSFGRESRELRERYEPSPESVSLTETVKRRDAAKLANARKVLAAVIGSDLGRKISPDDARVEAVMHDISPYDLDQKRLAAVAEAQSAPKELAPWDMSEEETMLFGKESGDKLKSSDWSFVRDNGRDALTYIASYSGLDRKQLNQVWEEMEKSQNYKDILNLIKRESTVALPTKAEVEQELQNFVAEEKGKAIDFFKQKEAENKEGYESLVKVLKSYRPDMQFPNYDQAVRLSEMAINRIEKNNFGLTEDNDTSEQHDPVILELADRYQMLVRNGEMLQELRQAADDEQAEQKKVG